MLVCVRKKWDRKETGYFRLVYEYEIEYEYDRSKLVCLLSITIYHTTFVPTVESSYLPVSNRKDRQLFKTIPLHLLGNFPSILQQTEQLPFNQSYSCLLIISLCTTKRSSGWYNHTGGNIYYFSVLYIFYKCRTTQTYWQTIAPIAFFRSQKSSKLPRQVAESNHRRFRKTTSLMDRHVLLQILLAFQSSSNHLSNLWFL